MSDLIRRDEALKEVLEASYLYFVNGKPSAVCNAPAVDAVEVVRCKDCLHWRPMDNGSWMNEGRTDGCCRMLLNVHCSARYITENDHFCGYGERRNKNAVD